jgi:hypothetical protein
MSQCKFRGFQCPIAVGIIFYYRHELHIRRDMGPDGFYVMNHSGCINLYTGNFHGSAPFPALIIISNLA